MTYPPPSDGWQDPAWSGHQPDPTLPASGPPISAPLIGKDPYAPADPYAGAPLIPGQAGPVDPYAAAAAYPQQSGYPQVAGFPGYGGYQPPPPQNGLAIASMIVSIIGAIGLCGYGLGGYVGVIGAILGHVARKQIRERGEGGAGFATAGIVVGWISTAIAVLATIALVVFFVWLANQESSTGYGTSY
ncbi:DUF4190 domain-containing protein [Micromonospora matsumotoense]|uniref:DUF4190 domain-containing protein n=1 Tax=Micromonospora matsumotoense TaxID=121616 RepID=UPI0034064A75